ncbi:MAG TPA: cysteine--tRNA ligase [Actinomycetes bacterium]|nr:cysteine--tRNA ligase [Actinomycetes bacterium]
MRLYDSRTRAVETIKPRRAGLLAMYCCGPTVYRDAHVGNLRTFLLGDLIGRVAATERRSVQTVQNITDVGHMVQDADIDPTGEDKVLAQARREGRSALDIARHYESGFRRDLDRLGIRPAMAYPRASDSIGLMHELIDVLMAAGHAYVGATGTVFFDSRSFPDYGAISGNRLDSLKPGHRFEHEIDAGKRFHADWALWKSADPARREMVWDSPWGPGFPGWHIECSAMSLHYLDRSVDVHVGGIDLRFPHHENERAQSDAATGREVVRHWVHGEHLLFEGRKMAKSTGNVILLDDIVGAGHDPLALRLAFLEHRYRAQLNLTWATIGAADRTLARWRAAVAGWAEQPSRPVPAALRGELVERFADDLDTAGALRLLRQAEKDTAIDPGAKFELFAAADQVLGLDLAREVGRAGAVIRLPDGATDLLDRRMAARAAKDWTTADQLRDELAKLGVTVVDTPRGQQVVG